MEEFERSDAIRRLSVERTGVNINPLTAVMLVSGGGGHCSSNRQGGKIRAM
jgi:hypothetical protein